MTCSLVYTVAPPERWPVQIRAEAFPTRIAALQRARALMADEAVYGIHLHGRDGMLDDVELARLLRMPLRRRVPYTDCDRHWNPERG